MSGLFSKTTRTNMLETANRNLASRFSTTDAETIAASFDEQNRNNTILGQEADLMDEYNTYTKELERLTGETFPNPLRSGMVLGTIDGRAGEINVPAQRDQAIKEFETRIRKLQESNPGIPLLTSDTMNERVGIRRQDRRQRTQDAREGGGGAISSFVGATGGIMADPLLLGTMAFGAPAASGILRAMLIEARVGIVSETALQAGVQSGRERFGEQASLPEAVEAVGGAGLGGGLGAAAFRGIGAGVRSTRELLRRSREIPRTEMTRSQVDAQRFLERKVEIEDANPFFNTPLGRAEHAQRFDSTVNRLRNGTAVGRVFDAQSPVRVQAVPVRSGEPVGEFVARLRSQDPVLFSKIDALDGKIEKAKAKLAELEGKAPTAGDRRSTVREGPDRRQRDLTLKERGELLKELQDVGPRGPTLERRKEIVRISAKGKVDITSPESAAILKDSDEVLKLKKQKTATTDKRKIKRLDRKIEEITKRQGGDPTPKAREIKKANTRTINAKAKLNKEIATLNVERGKLNKKADQAIKKLEPKTGDSFDLRQLDLPPSVKAMNDLGVAVRAVTQSRADARLGADVSLSSARTIRPSVDDAIIPATPAKASAADEILETQVRDMIEADENLRLLIEDENGNIRDVSGREFLDDLADDETFERELAGCIKGALA